MKVHVKQVFQGATDSIAQIEGIWLIDYANSKTLQIGDKLGDYTLTTIINGVGASNLGSLVFEYVITIKDSGTLPGGSYSPATGINDNGQIVGDSDTGTGHQCVTLLTAVATDNQRSTNETHITTNASEQHDPAIYCDSIVWFDARNEKWDLYTYNLLTSTETQITNDKSMQIIQPSMRII